MARSLTLAAFLALRGSGERTGRGGADWPDRPAGRVIWFRLQRADRIPAAVALAEAIRADGDPFAFVATLPRGEVIPNDGILSHMLFLEEPAPTPAGVARFIDHWAPDTLVWVGGALEPGLIVETDDRIARRILLDAREQSLGMGIGSWWFSRIAGPVLDRFDHILAVDAETRNRLARLTSDKGDRIEVTGRLDEGAPILSCREDDRADLAAALGTRPVWVAASATLAEVNQIAAAHRQAARRAHRLMLVFDARHPEEGAEIAERFEAMRFQVVRRSTGVDLTEGTQILVADDGPELGLWYRLAPIAYMGNTLVGGGSPDPFAAAALGSATIHGPLTTPHPGRFAQLDAVGATRAIRTAEELGQAVETLLAPDKAALVAHAAWEVISSGAGATNRAARLIARDLPEEAA